MMLKTGIVIFFGIHLIPFFEKPRSLFQNLLGENLYKGIYSLISLVGLLLIVYGYESDSRSLYSAVAEIYRYSPYLMFLSFVLLVAANFPTHMRRAIKHPMALGVAIWASVHLMTNPDLPSLILFGSFLGYSVFSVVMSELRVPRREELNPRLIFDFLSILLGSLVTYGAFTFHEHLSGARLYL